MSAVEAAGMTINGGTSMRAGGAVVAVAVMITAGVGGTSETTGGNMGLRKLGSDRILFLVSINSDTFPVPTYTFTIPPAYNRSTIHAL